MTTPLDLDAIEALANAATGTEWRVEDDGDTMWINVGAEKESIGQFLNEPDAYFVAAARSAVPALIAECRALRAENARLVACENALRPFADYAARIVKDHPGWDHDGFSFQLPGVGAPTMREFLCARETMAPHAPGKDG